MTRAVFRKKEGLYINFEVNGHASYADSGNDIVCAGISTAVIMSINLLDKLIPDLFEVIQDDAVGVTFLQSQRSSRREDLHNNRCEYLLWNTIAFVAEKQSNRYEWQ